MNSRAGILSFALLAITYAQDIAPIFNTNCTECHSPGNNLDLASYPFTSTKTTDQSVIVEWVLSKSGGSAPFMPPGNRPKLTQSEHSKIQQWLDDGLAP